MGYEVSLSAGWTQWQRYTRCENSSPANPRLQPIFFLSRQTKMLNTPTIVGSDRGIPFYSGELENVFIILWRTNTAQLFKCFISSALLQWVMYVSFTSLSKLITVCGKILDISRELNIEQCASEVLNGNKVTWFRGPRGTFPTHFNILSVFTEAKTMQEVNSSGCLTFISTRRAEEAETGQKV